jgi:pyridoxal phosphate enzyme (YggS family)
MSIADNLEEVRSRIADAAGRSGRRAGEITLVAVTKTWPVAVIEEAVAAGQRVFGENKVQEVVEKAPAMSGDLSWHFIGHLQKNKIRKVLPLCKVVHSIDSLELAQRVDRISEDLDLRREVLLQVNVAEDEAKFGFGEEELRSALPSLRELSHLSISGLMTVPRFDPDPEVTRPHFARLRELRDTCEREFELSIPGLSMGMSHDFEVAIEEGATLVRVGSSIFGQRDYAQ